MNMSFYTAARAAMTQQQKLDVVANNLANINTTAYKSKTAVFQDLVYANMRATDEEPTNLYAGTSSRISHTNTNFQDGGFAMVGGDYNFAISGEGFFMVQNPATEEISYTRDGSFQLSLNGEGFNLINNNGNLVLGEDGAPIVLTEGELTTIPAVFNFTNTDGMVALGNGEYVPITKNGEAVINNEAKVMRGALENSNVDTALEMANTIESSRAYSYVLKMMQTSDEVQQTINGLRR